jgi:tripartite-type tricarboxylate transporter receptor subunit TctC
MNYKVRRPKAALAMAIVVAMLFAGFSSASAQFFKKKSKFPDHPVTFIIGWETGGGSDIVARILCAEAEKFLGQPIVVVNKPGGSGAKAYMEIANAKPDGYLIGNTTGTISTHKFMGVIPIASEAFEIVTTFNSDPGAIWVAKDSPYKTLKDLVEAARKNPETITVAASNPGSITRFGTQLLEKNANVRFKLVSQSGGESAGPTMVAGGHVDAAQAAVVTALSLYQAGLIRPLGVMDEKRIPAFPEIPTYKEQGYNVSISNYRQILAPKDTPKEVMDALYSAFKKAAESEKFQKFMNESGSVPLAWTPAKSKEFLAKQDEMFKKMIVEMGLYKEFK